MGGALQGSPNTVYGDYADPEDWGSGSATGDYFGGPESGAGGGVLRLRTGKLELEGKLLSSGINDGAGGSIFVSANSLHGNGQIQAAGADGAYGDDGASGGGRVAVYARDFGQFNTNRIAANGGRSNKANGTVLLPQ